MTRSEVALRTRRWALLSILAFGPVASMLPVQGAHAQANACDQLKVRLAARIDPSIRGFALETVPASTPVPPGAKVIGTCEGGAKKVLLRRSVNTPSPLDAASAEGTSASPSSEAVAAPVANRREAKAASSPVAPPAIARATIAPTPPGSPADERVAVVQGQPAQAKGSDTSARSGAVEGADEGQVKRVVLQDVQPPVSPPSASTPPNDVSAAQRASEFVRRYGYAIAALMLVILAAALWPWLVHRSRYDASGLPRGPKIS
jgi:hypothetical protein